MMRHVPCRRQGKSWLRIMADFDLAIVGGGINGAGTLLPASSTVDLAHDPLGAPLQARYRHGFEYSDCQAHDSRLVVINALDAAERGAAIRTRTRCVRAERADVWRLVLANNGTS